MVEVPSWLSSSVLKVAIDWGIAKVKGTMTVGTVAGALGVLALSAIAVTDVLSYRDAVRERAEAPARAAAQAEQARTDMEAYGASVVQRVVDVMREETETDDAAMEEERARGDKRRMLERLARHRSLIINCTTIPPYILTDVHEIPMYFNDDPEVMEAYGLLVGEPGQSPERRGQMTEVLFQAMARVTNSTDRFPAVPTFAPEFTIGC